MLSNHLTYFSFTILILALFCLLFTNCGSTTDPLLQEWMEVRNASPISGEALSKPESYFRFKKGGRFVADLPNIDYPFQRNFKTKGTYIVKDSLLTLQTKYGRRLWDITGYTNFIIQQLEKDQLVLLAHTSFDGNFVPKEVLTFFSLEKYNTYTPKELREQYAYTTQDSLIGIENRKRGEAIRAIQANNIYSPFYKGGAEAMKTFIQKNLRYPKDHTERVTIFVDFIINEKGEVTELKSNNKQAAEYYIEEAKRVIQSMPDWKPSVIEGQPRSGAESMLIIFDKEAAKK